MFTCTQEFCIISKVPIGGMRKLMPTSGVLENTSLEQEGDKILLSIIA